MIRGLLVTMVVVFHYTVRWAPPDYPVNLFHFDHAYPRWLGLGAFGVHVFFVISGYVIALSVMRARSALRFAISRFLRIYPGFVLAVALSFAVPWLFGPAQLRSSAGDLAATLVLLPPELHQRYTDGAFWTLSVEAKFYFLCFVGYLGLKERFWLLLAGLGVAGPLIWRVAPGVGDKLLIAPYIGYFLMGMAMWYAHQRQMRGAALGLGLAGVFAYAMAFDTIRIDGTVALAAHCMIIGLIAMIGFFARYNPVFKAPVLSWLGDLSYELYLVHQILGVALIGWLKQALGVPDGVAMAGAGAGAVAVAVLVQRASGPLRVRCKMAIERMTAAAAPPLPPHAAPAHR